MGARIETFDAATIAARTAPVTGWRRMMADCAVVCGASAVCHVLGAATGLVLRMFVGPAEMGIWQAVKLALNYANYANLGISKGAVREFTIARGQGDTASAKKGLDLAFTVNTLTSLAYAGVLVAAGVWIAVSSGGPWSAAWAVGMFVAGGLAVLQRHVTFQVTILRSAQSFGLTSQLSVLEAVLTLAVCGLATWRWGLGGLYASTVVVMIVSLAYVQRHQVVRLAWAWQWTEIRRLVAIGAPILLAGTVTSLFRSLDKLMILGYLEDREFQLGCYSLALMVGAGLFGVGNMLSLVMGPRYGEKYGRTGNRREVALLAARSSELLAAAMGLVAALAVVAGPPLLARMLPDYRPGLAPLLWLVPGSVAMALALAPSQYLVAVDRQNRALWAVVAATLLAALGNHAALTGGYGLPGVAAATTASYLVYLVLTVAVSIWGELDRAARLRYLAMHCLTLAPALGIALAAECLWPGGEILWTTIAAKAVLVAFVWAASALVGWHAGGWAMEWKQEPR
jgi:O-antigen/teichoic acid export membrane protein